MRHAIPALLLAASSLAIGQTQTVPGEQAQKNGVRNCQRSIDDLAKHVVKENKHASLGVWNSKSPDLRLFNAQVVVSYSDAKSLALLNVAPTRTGKCDGTYTTIFYTEKSCSIERETTFKDWKFSGELGGLVTVENQNGSLSKILMPAGSGCITVTTEVTYE